MTAPKKIEIREIERPVPGKNQILMEVKSCNICTFEQRVYSGEYPDKYPFNGGHEMAGYICEIGENVNPEAYVKGKKLLQGHRADAVPAIIAEIMRRIFVRGS